MIELLLMILQQAIPDNMDPFGNWTPLYIINEWALMIIPVIFILVVFAASGLVIYKFLKATVL